MLGSTAKRRDVLEAQREVAVDFLLFSLTNLYQIEINKSVRDTGLSYEEFKFDLKSVELIKSTIDQFKNLYKK